MQSIHTRVFPNTEKEEHHELLIQSSSTHKEDISQEEQYKNKQDGDAIAKWLLHNCSLSLVSECLKTLREEIPKHFQ